MKFIDSLFYFFGKRLFRSVNFYTSLNIQGLIYVFIVFNIFTLFGLLRLLDDIMNYSHIEATILMYSIFSALIISFVFLFLRYSYKERYEVVMLRFEMMDDKILKRYKIANIVYLIFTVVAFFYITGFKN